MLRKVFEACKIMNRKKIIHIWKRGLNTSGQWFENWGSSRGFNQIVREQLRCNLFISFSSKSMLPQSQPSLNNKTAAPHLPKIAVANVAVR
jgi:hypothetical protein